MLLLEHDKDQALKNYSDIKPQYFNQTYLSIYKHISDFYSHKGYVPNLEELQIYRSRDRKTMSAISSIILVPSEGIDFSLVIKELENQFAQESVLVMVDNLLDNISLMEVSDIQDSVSRMGLDLEDLVASSEHVFTIKDYKPFTPADAFDLIKFESGISDEWDRESGGYYLEDFILLGGKRGSGKSVVCCNLIAAQHRQGNVSIYATIEMSYSEVMDRLLSILSGVPFSKIKQQTTDNVEDLKIAEVLASLYEGGEELLAQHIDACFDKFAFQDEITTLKEKDEGRIIILDDRNLSINTLDSKVSMYKVRYGDKLKLVVLDYINQVELYPGADMYSWINQIELSKALKNQARKHKVVLVSPYQIDDEGKARFARGLLDSPDVAQLINVPDKECGHMIFETTKARSASDEGKYRVSIDWNTLSIDPRPVILEDEFEQPEEDYQNREAASELTL